MSAGADKVTASVDAALEMTGSSFKAGAKGMREMVERAMNMPGVGMGLALAGQTERRVLFDELERALLEEFDKSLAGHRPRLVAEVDQRAAGL